MEAKGGEQAFKKTYGFQILMTLHCKSDGFKF